MQNLYQIVPKFGHLSQIVPPLHAHRIVDSVPPPPIHTHTHTHPSAHVHTVQRDETDLDELWDFPEPVSLGKEQGGRTTPQLAVQPQLEPDTVHLCHRRAQMRWHTATQQLDLLTQGSHGNQHTDTKECTRAIKLLQNWNYRIWQAAELGKYLVHFSLSYHNTSGSGHSYAYRVFAMLILPWQQQPFWCIYSAA